jgi:methionyl aminopeptidase
MRAVPETIARPPYVGRRVVREPGYQVLRGEALDRMRAACRVAAEVLLETVAAVEPGVSTDELDAVAHEAYLRRGAYPSTLGYHTYRKSICTSVNDVVCHGIPDDYRLRLGDIINLDVTAYLDGYHGDTSATVGVGGLSAVRPRTAELVRDAREAMYLGIAAVAPGRELREIGRAIERFGRGRGYGVVRDIGGHGIGTVFHAAPHVSHVEHTSDTLRFVPGLCFTVEPMLNGGSHLHVEGDDGWAVLTADGHPSAQFEHTVVVTEDGVEILTVTADGRCAADEI